MRTVRAILYFLVGFLFSTWVVLSHAETIQATNGGSAAKVYKYTTSFGTSGKRYAPSAAEVCQEIAPFVRMTYPSAQYSSTFSGGCNYTYAPAAGAASVSGWSGGLFCPEIDDGNTANPATCENVYTCPSTGGWTLSGTQCTRPDCQAGETRNETTGACESACLAKAGQSSFSWVTYFNDSPPAANACEAGCAVYQMLNAYDPAKPQNDGVYYYTATTKTVQMKTQYTGGTCTAGGAMPASSESNPTNAQPPEPPKKPVCAATEGVLTSSKGTVACVPQGTPSAETPKVAVKKTTETFDDGSQKITTETTTQVPSTQAKDVQTSVQVTPNSSGTAGQAGTPGTTGSGAATVSDSNGDGAGDGGGDCDPTKDFCGGPGTGGLYEKKPKTVASVVGDFKAGIMSSGIGSAMTGFFTVSTPGGSCPSWVVDVAFLNTTLNLSQYFCTATAISMMQLVGAVLMFVAAFVGFRWAIL